MKNTDSTLKTKIKPERGKYAHLLERGSNVALLAPDVVEHFPDSESVNHALRAFLAFGKEFELVVAPARPPRPVTADKRKPAVDPRVGRVKQRSVAAR